MTPIINEIRTEGGVASGCRSNLFQFGRVLLQYHGEHGSFPPAFTTNASGQRMHSWRALLLRDSDEFNFMEKLDLSKAWNAPANQQVTDTVLSMYQCPRYRWSRGATTSYLAVVGPGTAWPGAQGSKLEDFHDGPANTILLVEVADVDIPWAEPVDLEFDTLFSTSARLRPSSLHRNPAGFHALFADGSVKYLRADLEESQLRALFTIAGGERVDPAAYIAEAPAGIP